MATENSELTPAYFNYYYPPEWHPHERCWMAWPGRSGNWTDLQNSQKCFASVINTISEFEPVSLLCWFNDLADAKRWVSRGVDIIPETIDDCWLRDNGPSFVLDKQGNKAGIDWQFNGYGRRYTFINEDRIASSILGRQQLRRFTSALHCEGGAFHVDGNGTLITTKQCLLNHNRNPGWSQHDVEQQLRESLNVRHFIWLDAGLVDDHTDGHIDELASFVDSTTLLALTTQDQNDANYDRLSQNHRRLLDAKNADNKSYNLITIDQPSAKFHPDKSRLPMSYINYYMANGAIIMPAFDDKKCDANAFSQLTELFPARKVIQLPCLDMFDGGGGIHCATQQEPKVGFD